MNSYDTQLLKLEEAHVRHQFEAWKHFTIHCRMFVLALKYRDWKEVRGQVPRIILAIPGSLTKRAPRGNVGTTKMGIFESTNL